MPIRVVNDKGRYRQHYMLSKPSVFSKSKTSEAVDQTDYYPTVSCVRYDAERDAYNVSLEEFVLRERSDPKPPAAAPKKRWIPSRNRGR